MSRSQRPSVNPAPRMAFEQGLTRIELPTRVRQTALVLAHFMSGLTGEARPGQRLLAATWGVGRKRLDADVAVLVEVGLLRVRKRAGQHGTDVYSSRARFVDGTADVVLDDGRRLCSARPTGERAEHRDPSLQRAPQGNALQPRHDDPQRAPSGSPRVPSGSQRAPQGTRNTTTPEQREGGGGGSALSLPPPAGASGDSSPTTGANRGDVVAVIEAAELIVQRRHPKVTIARHDERLNSVIADRLGAGWPVPALAERATDEQFPPTVIAPSSLLASRIRKLAARPEPEVIAESQRAWCAVIRELVDADHALDQFELPTSMLTALDAAADGHVDQSSAPRDAARCRREVHLAAEAARRYLRSDRRLWKEMEVRPDRIIAALDDVKVVAAAACISWIDDADSLDIDMAEVFEVEPTEWHRWRDDHVA